MAQCAYYQLHRAVLSKTKAQFLNHTSSVSGIHSCAYPEQYRHKMVLLSKVVLNRTVGAMTEQLRIAGNRDDYERLELFCEAEKTGCGMKTALE